MSDVLITKVNETFVRITAEKSTLKEIESKFKFHPKNYRFDPRFTRRVWDGYIKLFKSDERLLYIGILDKLVTFLRSQAYSIKIEGDFGAQVFSEHEARNFVKTLNLPSHLEVRDYQLKYFITCVRNHRAICESPTNSGKSLIQYLLFRYFNRKTLIVVPSTQLVLQMESDFKSYGYEGEAHLIMEGREKNTDCQLIISTYHSIYNLPVDWFSDKEVILGDEVHTFKAKSLISIMEKCKRSLVRIGVTGTIPEDDILAKMTIQGLFGPIHKYISSKQLIEKGYSTPLIIKVLTLNHLDSAYWNNTKKIEYEDEIAFILKSEKRIEFLKNLVVSLKGNTFLMFKEIEYGKKLYESIKDHVSVPIFYVDGNMEVENRKDLIARIETLENSITICSTVFTTGINIKKLNNLIFARPSKSRIQVMQSIGRGLRKSPDKSHITLYDISDKIIGNIDNVTIDHRSAREKMYDNENFPYKSYSINLKDSQG